MEAAFPPEESAGDVHAGRMNGLSHKASDGSPHGRLSISIADGPPLSDWYLVKPPVA